MIVYRVCNKEEIENIFKDNSFINIGHSFIKSNLNTHNYNEKIKYLHFFANINNIFYLRTLKDRYLCTYDIPCDILNNYQGIGYYLDYINYRELNEVIEYAVCNNVIELSYLKEISYIKENIDYEDFIEDYLERIYTNNIKRRVLVLEGE